MRNLVFILLIIIGSMSVVSCSSDDLRSGESCFECTMTGVATEICRIGNENYTVTVIGGPPQEYSLPEDQTWEEFREEMLWICE